MNHNISQLQDETEDLKGQRASLEAAIADAEQCSAGRAVQVDGC